MNNNKLFQKALEELKTSTAFISSEILDLAESPDVYWNIHAALVSLYKFIHLIEMRSSNRYCIDRYMSEFTTMAKETAPWEELDGNEAMRRALLKACKQVNDVWAEYASE